MDNGRGWYARFRAKVLMECCVDKVNEEALVEAVRKRKFSLPMGRPSRSFKDYDIQFVNGVVWFIIGSKCSNSASSC